MKYSRASSFVFGPLLAGLSNAWILDPSCKNSNFDGKPYEDLVTSGMKSAFNLAQAGSDALDAINGGTANLALRDLRDYVFKETDGSQPHMDLATSVFTAVLAYRTNGNNGDPTPKPALPLPADEVIVYCDYSRFDENSDGTNDKKGFAFDKDIQEVVEMDSDYTGCKNSVNFDTTMAWTLNHNDDNKVAQIQICKWYLQASNPKKRKFITDIIGPKALLSKPIDGILSLIGSRKPMDAAALFDATMLHEMTHAIASDGNQHPTSDTGGKSKAYGWDNIVRLSPFGPNADSFGGSTQNADSYAYFGVGASLIANTAAPQRPLLDGTIVALPPGGGPARRFVHWENSIRSIAHISPRQANASTSAAPFGNATTSISSSQVGTAPPPVSTTSSTPVGTAPVSSSSSTPIGTAPVSSDSSTPSPASSTPISVSSSSVPTENSTTAVPPPVSSTGTLGGNTTAPVTSQPGSGDTTETPDPTFTLPPATSTFSSVPVTSSGTTTFVPITVITATSSGTTTPVTYISTFTSSGDIKPTGAWMCTGDACDQGSSCIIPLFCAGEGGSGHSWGLCCGWSPPPAPGGGPPPAGGPSPAPPGSDTEPTDTASASQSQSTTSSESCTETQTASACAETVTIFTPSGSASATTSTITATCSTTQGCSVTDTTSTTTQTSDANVPTETPIYDQPDFDGNENWLDDQASALDILASETGEPSTFSASSTATNSSVPTSSGTPAPSTSNPQTTLITSTTTPANSTEPSPTPTPTPTPTSTAGPITCSLVTDTIESTTTLCECAGVISSVQTTTVDGTESPFCPVQSPTATATETSAPAPTSTSVQPNTWSFAIYQNSDCTGESDPYSGTGVKDCTAGLLNGGGPAFTGNGINNCAVYFYEDTTCGDTAAVIDIYNIQGPTEGTCEASTGGQQIGSFSVKCG